MANCPRCGKTASILDRDLATGLCAGCRRNDAEKQRHDVEKQRHRRDAQQAKQLETERVKRLTSPLEEPINEPLDGLVLVGISVAAAVLGGLLLAAWSSSMSGYVVLSIAGMLYLQG